METSNTQKVTIDRTFDKNDLGNYWFSHQPLVIFQNLCNRYAIRILSSVAITLALMLRHFVIPEYQSLVLVLAVAILVVVSIYVEIRARILWRRSERLSLAYLQRFMNEQINRDILA